MTNVCVFCCNDAEYQGPPIQAETLRSNLLYLSSTKLIAVNGRLRRTCEGCYRRFYNGYSLNQIQSLHLNGCTFCQSCQPDPIRSTWRTIA